MAQVRQAVGVILIQQAQFLLKEGVVAVPLLADWAHYHLEPM